MADDLLTTIFEVEKEIRAELLEERQKAAHWLVERQEAVDREVGAKRALCREDCRKREEEARKKAQAEASDHLARAEAYASELDSLEPLFLTRVLAPFLRRILEEEL